MINIFKNENVKVIKPKEDVDIVAILDSKGNKIFQTDKKDFIIDKYPIDLQYLIDNDKLDIFDKNSEKFDIVSYIVMFCLFFELDFKINNNDIKISNLFPNITIIDKESLIKFLYNFFEKEFNYYIKLTRFNLINYLDYFQPKIKNNEKLKSLMLDFFSNQDFYTSKIDENVKNKIKELVSKKRFCFLEDYNNYYSYKNNNTNEELYLKNSVTISNQLYFLHVRFFLENKNYNSTKENYDIVLDTLSFRRFYDDKNINIILLERNDNKLFFQLFISKHEDEIFYYFIKSKEGIFNNKYHINGWVRVL